MLAMLVSGMAVSAQSVLDKLVFEAPKKLIKVKGNTANVRHKPSLKAPLVFIETGFDDMPQFKLNNHTLYPVVEELDGWYKIESYVDYMGQGGYELQSGYVSKTVVIESEYPPLYEGIGDAGVLSFARTLFAGDGIYGGDVYQYWSPTANPNYFIFVEGYSEEGDVGQGTSVTLWLGKRVGNILVFKYPTHKSFIYDNSAGKKLLLDDYDGIHYCSEGPLDYRFCDFLYGYVMFQFNEFTDEMLEVLFEHSIQINSDAVLYLTMDLLQ